MPCHKDDFARHLRAHAERGFGVRKCATYVRQAMVAGTRCVDLTNEDYDAELWVLARDPASRGEVMIVSGRSIPRRPELSSDPDDRGVMPRLHGGECTLIGPALEPFADPEDYRPDVSGPELAALADDAARRYVAAFGGVRALCAAVAKQRVRVAKAPPVLARAFRRAAACLPRG